MAYKSLTEQSAALAKRLSAIPSEIVREVRPALVASANDLANVARALVHVDKGDLKSSISVSAPGETTPAYAEGGGKRTAGENQALVTVGNPEVRHGHFQEFGTVTQEAQPFLRPANRLTREKNRRRIGAAIGRAVRKAASGGDNG
jgi:HK97 gp10 family phage protein